MADERLRAAIRTQTEELRYEIRTQTDEIRREIRFQADGLRYEIREFRREMNERLDSLNRTLVGAVVVIVAAIIGSNSLG